MLHILAHMSLDFVFARASVHASRHGQPEVVPGVPDDVTGVAHEVEHEVGAVDVTQGICDPKAPGLLVDLRMLENDEGLAALCSQIQYSMNRMRLTSQWRSAYLGTGTEVPGVGGGMGPI